MMRTRPTTKCELCNKVIPAGKGNMERHQLTDMCKKQPLSVISVSSAPASTPAAAPKVPCNVCKKLISEGAGNMARHQLTESCKKKRPSGPLSSVSFTPQFPGFFMSHGAPGVGLQGFSLPSFGAQFPGFLNSPMGSLTSLPLSASSGPLSSPLSSLTSQPGSMTSPLSASSSGPLTSPLSSTP